MSPPPPVPRPIVDVAPLYLGVEQGIFAKHGLDVQPQLAQGGAAIVRAVISGDYQFGFSNMTAIAAQVLAEDGLT